MKEKTFLLVFLVALISVNTYSQSNRRIGLSGTVQNSQFGISLPIWVGQKIVLAPTLDFKYAEKIGSDFSIGLSPRFYFNTEKLAPYLGFKIGTMINLPSSENEIDNETKIDLLFGLAFGAEYFIDENLSFGVEAQGNLTKSDENSNRFGNPDGLNFNTGTMISATIYF